MTELNRWCELLKVTHPCHICETPAFIVCNLTPELLINIFLDIDEGVLAQNLLVSLWGGQSALRSWLFVIRWWSLQVEHCICNLTFPLGRQRPRPLHLFKLDTQCVTWSIVIVGVFACRARSAALCQHVLHFTLLAILYWNQVFQLIHIDILLLLLQLLYAVLICMQVDLVLRIHELWISFHLVILILTLS